MSKITRVQSMSKWMKIRPILNTSECQSSKIQQNLHSMHSWFVSSTFEILNKSQIKKMYIFDGCFQRSGRQKKIKDADVQAFFVQENPSDSARWPGFQGRQKASTIYFLISSNYSHCLQSASDIQNKCVQFPVLQKNQFRLLRIFCEDFEGDDK